MNNFEGLNTRSIRHLIFLKEYAYEYLLPETREKVLEALSTINDTSYSIEMRRDATICIQQAFDFMQVEALMVFLEVQKETLQYTFGDDEGLAQFKEEYGIEDPAEVVE